MLRPLMVLPTTILLAVCPTCHARDDRNVVPGVGISDINLGETTMQALAKHGAPTKRVGSNPKFQDWIYDAVAGGQRCTLELIFQNDHLAQIATNGRAFMLSGGLGPGTPLWSWYKKFPTWKTSRVYFGDHPFDIRYSPVDGIGIAYDMSPTVTRGSTTVRFPDWMFVYPNRGSLFPIWKGLSATSKAVASSPIHKLKRTHLSKTQKQLALKTLREMQALESALSVDFDAANYPQRLVSCKIALDQMKRALSVGDELKELETAYNAYKNGNFEEASQHLKNADYLLR